MEKKKEKEKQERKPDVWNCVPGAVPSTIPCSKLSSCDGEESRVTLVPPSSKAKPRLRGCQVQITWRNRVPVWGGAESAPRAAGASTAAFQLPRESAQTQWSPWSTAGRKALWEAAVRQTGRQVPSVLPMGSESLSPSSLEQRVSFNSLTCQEPHLLLHLKWEYFVLSLFGILIG